MLTSKTTKRDSEQEDRKTNSTGVDRRSQDLISESGGGSDSLKKDGDLQRESNNNLQEAPKIEELSSLEKINQEINKGPGNRGQILRDMDETIDTELIEIKELLSARKNANVFEATKYRLPVISEGSIPALLKYKDRRHNLMDKISEVTYSIEEEPLSSKITENLNTFNEIVNDLTPEKLSITLCEFFRSRSIQLVQKSRLYLSRWAKVYKSADSFEELQLAFQKASDSNTAEYSECLERYDRLRKTIEWQEYEQYERLKAIYAANNISDARFKAPTWKPTDLGWLPDDLAVFLRHYLKRMTTTRHLHYLQAHLKNMVKFNRSLIIEDYIQHNTLFLSTLTDEEINNFGNPELPRRDSPPMKRSELKPFIDQFENLAAYYSIPSDIDIEEGRLFGHDVKLKFAKLFQEQNRDLFIQNPDDVTTDTEKVEENIMGEKVKVGPIIKVADWLNRNPIIPKTDPWLEKQKSILAKRNEVDFELRNEYDLICSGNLTSFLHKVSEKIKPLMESNGVKFNSYGAENLEFIADEADAAGGNNASNSSDAKEGMRSGADSIASRRSKIADFDSQHNMEEITMEDGSTRVVSKQTICHVFNEHLLFAFLELRYLRIREYRAVLLEYLNYFRSIEKRITNDVKSFDEFHSSIFEPLKKVNQKMKSKDIETISAGNPMKFGKELPRIDALDLSRYLNPNVLDKNEDIRVLSNDGIKLVDENDIPYVYDVALNDLKVLEEHLLQIATFYINKDMGVFDPEADSAKIRADRQGPKKKETMLDYTYLKPFLDRAQILLEIYNIETKFQEQKLQVVNTYMDMYEHVSDPNQMRRLGQEISNLIAERPELDMKADYFIKSYLYSGRALEHQVTLLEDVYTFVAKQQRSFIEKYDQDLMIRKLGVDEIGAMLSPCASGLPKFMTANHSILFHSDRLAPIDILEITDHLHEVLDITDKIQRNIDSFAKEFEENKLKTCNRSFVRYIMWDCAIDAWMNISQIVFDKNAPQPIRKLHLIEDQTFFDNPYTPDLILRELFSTYLSSPEHSLNRGDPLDIEHNLYNRFSDPGIREKAKNSLLTALKVIVQRNRLILGWYETEFLKNQVCRQLHEMNVLKDIRPLIQFKPLPFNYTDANARFLRKLQDYEAIDEEDEDKQASEDRKPGSERWGALAINEMDDKICSENLKDMDSYILLLNEDYSLDLSYALKIQCLDYSTMLVSMLTNGSLLVTYHFHYLYKKREGQMLNSIRRKFPNLNLHYFYDDNESEAKRPQLPEYPSFVLNFVARKRQLRRLMTNKYAQRFSDLSKSVLDDQDVFIKVKPFKFQLYTWYFKNLSSTLKEHFEKLEYFEICRTLNLIATNTVMGKVTFKGNVMQDEQQSKLDMTDKNVIYDLQNTVVTQEVVDGDTPLFEMWAFSHEYNILAIPVSDAIIDINEYTNQVLAGASPNLPISNPTQDSQFRKIYKIMDYILEIFYVGLLFSKLNIMLKKTGAGFAPTSIREYEWIIATFGSFKRDLNNLGNPIQYSDLEQFMRFKAQYFCFKYRLLLDRCYEYFACNGKMVAASVFKKKLEFYESKEAKAKAQHFSFLDLGMPDFYRLDYECFSHEFFMKMLDPEDQKIVFLKHQEFEYAMDQFLVSSNMSSTDNPMDIVKWQLEHLQASTKLIQLRTEFFRLYGLETDIKFVTSKQYSDVYTHKILAPAIALYIRNGSKGNATNLYLLRNEWLNDPSANFHQFNKTAQVQFDKCQSSVLTEEISIIYTKFFMSRVRLLHTTLIEEFTGKLFRMSQLLEVPAIVDDTLNYGLQESDYIAKMALIGKFITDLKMAEQAVFPGDLSPNKAEIFCCTRFLLNQAIGNLSTALTRWQSQKAQELQYHYNSMSVHAIQLIQQKDEEIGRLKALNNELLNTFKIKVRMLSADTSADIYMDLATANTELNDTKKQRRAEEKKIRTRVVEEYSDLVKELTMQVHVLKNRFNEYRQTLFYETLEIMSEAKMEQLNVLSEGMEGCSSLVTENAKRLLEYEGRLGDLMDENQELSMTISKMRSIHAIKDVAIRTVYERKIKKLGNEIKMAEEKLWDCYQDSEAREKILKKQLNRSQKDHVFAEGEIDSLKKELKEEQKLKQVLTRTKMIDEQKIKNLHDKIGKLERYEGIDIDYLLSDNMEKEKLIEEYKKDELRRKALEKAKASRRKMLSKSSKSILFAAALGHIDHETLNNYQKERNTSQNSNPGAPQRTPSLAVEGETKLPPVEFQTLGDGGNSVIFLPTVDETNNVNANNENPATSKIRFSNNSARPTTAIFSVTDKSSGRTTAIVGSGRNTSLSSRSKMTSSARFKDRNYVATILAEPTIRSGSSRADSARPTTSTLSTIRGTSVMAKRSSIASAAATDRKDKNPEFRPTTAKY